MTFGTTLGEHLTMAAYAHIFYIATDYKNKINVEVSASYTNIKNIKTHQLFFKEHTLGVCVSITQRKISVDLHKLAFA